MFKVLLVDDEATNAKILGFHIKNFLTENNITEFEIDDATNGYEAFGMHYFNHYDLVMLDVRMPKFDGIKLLNTLRKTSGVPQPIICMVTSLGEEKYKSLFKLKGANSYIIKPFDKDIIYKVLGKLLEDKISSAKVATTKEDDFFDFDAFDDFEDMNDTQGELAFVNLSHGKISAKDFLVDYPNITYILDEIEELDELLDEIIDSLDKYNFEKYKEKIGIALNKYGRFLNTFESFQELSSSLVLLESKIDSIALENFNDKEAFYLINYLVSIFEDLNNWKKHVFVVQDAGDVYYANASLLSNCMQLEDILKR